MIPVHKITCGSLKIQFIISLTLAFCQGTFAQINKYWGEGSIAVTCAPSAFNEATQSFDDDYVIAIIDTRRSCEFHPLSQWPASGEVYPGKFFYQPGSSWKFSNLGTVFAMATDEKGNIYAAATTTYGSVQFPDGLSPNGQRGSGSIYKINGKTGAVNTSFVTTRQATTFSPSFPNSIPNKTISGAFWGFESDIPVKSGTGLGDLVYNRYHKFLYTSNFEDGKIYKIDPDSGNIVQVYDPRFGDHSVAGLDDGGSGFSSRGQRPWALGINKENDKIKLYYSNWRIDSRDTFPENAYFNEIWSAELDAIGNPIPSTEQLEIQIPHLTLAHPERPFHFSSNPVSDMVFSSTGQMFLSERGMDADFGRTVKIAWDTATGGLIPRSDNISNHARVLRYDRSGVGWTLYTGNDKFYEMGHDVSTNKSVNASGGITMGDYFCENCYVKDSIIYATGDFDDVRPNVFVYGVSGLPSGNGDSEDHSYLDFNGIVASSPGGTSPKTTPGDSEYMGVWEGEPRFGSIACNDLIHVSLDSNCCASITYDMLLKGEFPKNCLIVQLSTPNGVIIPGSPMICNQYVGQEINYMLIDTCFGNRCWGKIKLEDKLPPKNNCQNPDTVLCNNQVFHWVPPVITDNCTGPATLIIKSDETLKLNCESLCSAVRTIQYCYEDMFGNRSDICSKVICYRRPQLSDFVWPRDTVLSCEDWDSIPPPIATGVPMAGGYPIYPDWYLCKIAVQYQDQLIEVCKGTRKIIRTWTLVDWCKSAPENVIKYTQLIKIQDDKGPELKCPDPVTVSTNIQDCQGMAIINAPEIIRECSSASIMVDYISATGNGIPVTNGVQQWPGGGYKFVSLPLGQNMIGFHVSDDCGNISHCFSQIIVEDQVPPIAICDEKTVVALTQDGTGRLEATSLDDGSIDNCMIDHLEVLRMDYGGSCNFYDAGQWKPYTDFCCLDVGNEITVALQVTDKSGNSNTCMVNVQVQDKIPPYIQCPPDITVSCSFDYSDLSVFGSVANDELLRSRIMINDPNVQFSAEPIDGIASDGCLVSVEELNPNYNLTCGQGDIIRTWVATDIAGLNSYCNQKISIIDYNRKDIIIKWPEDYYSSTMCYEKPDFNPNTTGRPLINGAGKCNSVFVNYTDQVFKLEPDACVKILRKWSIIDWCYYHPNDPSSEGIWEWTQVIKLVNTSGPKITSDCSDRIIPVADNRCGGDVQLIAGAEDDCTAETDLVWLHKVDLYNDGITEAEELIFQGYGPDASAFYPVGKHRVTFVVTDGCGNSESCSFVMDIRDAKEPTPYCKTGIVTTIMPSTKTLDIWASDFDLGSSDNCTDKNDLIIYFDEGGNQSASKRLDCSNIGLNILKVYVQDQAGNRDYCEVSLDLQDPGKVCGGTNFKIAGVIKSLGGQNFPNANIFLNSSGSSSKVLSQNNGSYAFENILGGIDGEISVLYDQDPLNGISTMDILTIQKHLLGKSYFNQPMQYVAADANNSSSVTAADIAEIRKLLLGVTNNFPNNISWRFVPEEFNSTDLENPFPFAEKIQFRNLSKDLLNQNFVAIKIGDLNNDAVVGAGGVISRSKERIDLIAGTTPSKGANTFDMHFWCRDYAIINGFQISFRIPEELEFLGLDGGLAKIDSENYYFNNNVLNIVCSNISKADGQTPLFTIRVKEKTTFVAVHEIALNDQWYRNEMYSDEFGTKSVTLKTFYNGQDVYHSDGENIIISPNPFIDELVINIFSVKTSEAIISLFDCSGKTLIERKINLNQGMNTEKINGRDINNSGLYFVRVEKNNGVVIRPVVFNK